MISRARRGAALAVAGALLLASCSTRFDGVSDLGRQAADLAETSPPRFATYVALGDSFTAGPLIPSTDLAHGCFRSDSNYPALVADRLDVETLVDRSCSGARTRDLAHSQPTVREARVPPQLDGLDRGADLVTLGIGGNDYDLFHTLVGTCSRLRELDPRGTPCADALAARGTDLVAAAGRIGERVGASLRRIQRRAPGATVLLVSYPRLTPDDGRCTDLPFADGDYAYGARVGVALNTALERAARRSDVRFVDMHAASQGHDICSADAWVNGARTVEGRALAFHPFDVGMEAVADAVVAALRS